MGSDSMSEESPERRFRTLFISDVHLGARGSQAEQLLDFLKGHDADTIYLVGDIVDGWALQSNWYWPQSHNDFVQKMLRKARKGAKVIYVPGNHDEFLRNYYGTHFGGIDVVENTIHTGVDGRRYLVIHGDIFDLVVQNARWLAHLGDKAYDFAIQMNRLVNFFRRMFGVPYWSLSQWAKLKVKNAVNYIGAFEKTLAGEARRHGADGVICGHIHYATIRDALPRPAKITRLIAEAKPDAIHIATEGPIGLMVRRYCRKHRLPFTTSFHTRFPEYVRARAPIPESLIWRALRRFHAPSRAVMAATPALANELRMRGFENVVLWPRGVDTGFFHPRGIDLCLPAPVFLCVGRVAIEKNLEAFLDLDLPGTKVIVGDGPARATLEQKYPQSLFLGALQGEALAQVYAASDVFVFPSKT